MNRYAPRIALIGCGAIAECFYLPALAKHPQVLKNLVLVDKNDERVRAVASRFAIRDHCSECREVLGKVDGAIVAVPNRFHYQISMDFLRASIPVLCEKPLTESVAEAQALVAQANKAHVALAVNHPRRLFANHVKVKEMLSNGDIGDLSSLSYVEGWKFSWPTASGFYFDSRLQSKGILADVGAHVLDIICWWLGEKPALLSSENDSFGGVESVARVRFQHGKCLGEAQFNRLSRLRNQFRIVGDTLSVESGIEEWGSLMITTKSGRTTRLKTGAQEHEYNEFGHQIVDNFMDVIARNAQPFVPASDVLPSISWLEECYESAKRFKMPWYENLEGHYARH